MNKTALIILLIALDLALSFIDNIIGHFVPLSISLGFLTFYAGIWFRLSVFLIIINKLLKFTSLSNGQRNMIFWASIITQAFYLLWIYGQYIQLKEYL